MKNLRRYTVWLLWLFAVATFAYLFIPKPESEQSWVQRKAGFEQAALRAQPLIAAVRAYQEAKGQPPRALSDLIPDYLQEIPRTGLQRCTTFEYRLLTNRRAQVVWYDLGARQSPEFSGQSRFADGDPGHAILVFTLNSEGKISSALIDRASKDVEVLDFDPERWQARRQRMQMAPSLAETYRLYGMPRSVFEQLLGPADGSRAVDSAQWELRINCPTGLLSHNALIYWPGESYPQHLYGGLTEPVADWVYIRN